MNAVLSMKEGQVDNMSRDEISPASSIKDSQVDQSFGDKAFEISTSDGQVDQASGYEICVSITVKVSRLIKFEEMKYQQQCH